MIALLAFALVPIPHWTLASNDTVATIAIVNDRPVLQKLNAYGDAHNWCTASQISLIDHVWIGGRETPVHWKFYVSVLANNELKLVFQSEQPAIELDSLWRARKGKGPIEHWIEITNQTDGNITIPQQESLNLDSLKPGGTADVWWIRRGASNALTEGGVFQNPVKPGLDLSLVSDHHNPSSPVPWAAVQVGSTRGLYVGWEFSSLGRIAATSASNQSLDLKVGLMPDFKTDIHSGETLKMPAAFVGCYRGDMDAGSQSLHRFVMEHLRANPPKSFADPTTVCGIYLDAGGDHATEKTLLPTIAFAKSLNLDTYLADAMWFPACGDWRWDPARFPHGVKPIGDAIHKTGMNFALWCAWNNGGISASPGALSVRGPVGHPDWFGQDLPPNWQPGPFYGASADMGSPEAKAWALKKTRSMMDEMGFDYLKTDVDPMINECIRTDHRHSHGTDVSYWSTLGVYEVWDVMRKKNPKRVRENCSGASHIKDFGVLQRCAYTATTDTLSNLPDRAGIYDSTYVLPPAALMTYTYERGYNVPGDDPGSYLFRSAMMTAWDLAPTDSKDWTDEEKASARAATKTYREWLRPILKDCVVHHVLPRPDGKRWDGMFYWSEKLRKGTLFVFRPDSPESRQSVRLAGLSASKRYRVWSEDGSVPPGLWAGKELMTAGISISLTSRYSSDLIHMQDANLPRPRGWGSPLPFRLNNPVSKADYFGTTTTFSWTPSRGAKCYRVYLTTYGRSMNPALTERIVYEPRVTLATDVNEQKVDCMVDALGPGGMRIRTANHIALPPRTPWGGIFVSEYPWQKAEAGSGRVHRDENYAGKPLSMAGRVYRKGIWTHSFNDGRPADVVLEIGGKGFGTFLSDVGLDDASGGGSVQFQILVDGKVAQVSPVMKPHQVFHISVDVTGARELTLRVLNGGDGYNSDHSDWGLARLIKKGGGDPFRR